MLDSKRTILIKIRTHWAVSKFCLRQQFIYIQIVLHGNEIVQYQSKLQTSRNGPKSFKKALVESYKLHLN